MSLKTSKQDLLTIYFKFCDKHYTPKFELKEEFDGNTINNIRRK